MSITKHEIELSDGSRKSIEHRSSPTSIIMAFGAASAMMLTALAYTGVFDGGGKPTVLGDEGKSTIVETSTGPSPWYSENWLTWSDTGSYYNGDISVITGLTGTPGDFSNALELEFNDLSVEACPAYEPSLGVGITFPNAATDQPTEIWVEVPIFLGAGYQTVFCGGFAEHKFIFTFEKAGNTGRWNVMMGSSGDGNQLRHYPNDDSGGNLIAVAPGEEVDPPGAAMDITTELVGQGWKVLRIHQKMGAASTGEAEMWLDGVKIQENIGITTDTANAYFRNMTLGANSNHRPDTTGVMWRYGPLDVFINDPGW